MPYYKLKFELEGDLGNRGVPESILEKRSANEKHEIYALYKIVYKTNSV